jgi:hypothetical protein
MRYYLDTEFDGHGGALLSLALVEEVGISLYIRTTARAKDSWVQQNVEPLMHEHNAHLRALDVPPDWVGDNLRSFLRNDPEPVIIADSPVDIGRFCAAISTGRDGGWSSTDFARMTFEVHNVDCYPTTLEGAVQHNAWWDAMALRHLLQQGLK